MMHSWLKSKRFLWSIAVLLFILLYNGTPLGRTLGAVADPLTRAGGPFYRAGLAVKNFWPGLTGGFNLQKELIHKEKIIGELSAANAELQFLVAANRDWRAWLDLKDNPAAGEGLIPARVIWLNSGAGRSLLIINRGHDDGVAAKMPVLAPTGVFIGKVIKTSGHLATVLLATDRTSVVAATSPRDPALQAIVKGKLGLSLSLELIPQAARIEIGDIIVTSALEENTPSGLTVGRVAGVFYKEGELFKRANLEPLATASNLRVVAVVTPPR